MRGHVVAQIRDSFCLILAVLFFLPAVTWGSTRIGNAEIQVSYIHGHQFEFDDGEYGIDWVQFRNELRGKLTYYKLIDHQVLLDKVRVPLIEKVDAFADYQFRFDPVYEIRARYRRLFSSHTRQHLMFPENEFRELYADVDFGQVGPGYLSARLGKQIVVWGESDLFRSLDVVNPL